MGYPLGGSLPTPDQGYGRLVLDQVLYFRDGGGGGGGVGGGGGGIGESGGSPFTLFIEDSKTKAIGPLDLHTFCFRRLTPSFAAPLRP
jgi:hypothetical protein